MKTIAFDICHTICNGYRRNHFEDIIKLKPYPKMVKLIKDLKKKGHKVIFFTRRGAYSPKSIQLTKEWIKKWSIPVDEVIYCKPPFDLLIDNKAISPFRSNLTVGFIECKMEQIQDNIKKHTYKPKRGKL